MKMTILTSLLLLITVVSCNTTDPTPPDETKPTLTLALDDTSCTEVWLQLQTKDLALPAELTLKRYNPTGDSISQIFILNTQDSLLYIDSLLPNQTYKFKIVANTTNNPQPTTNQLTITTMDTTSHNFTFQSWTFGTVGSSTLYDIAIINENNIWAVGEIMIADTSINGYTTYNAVHWNGGEWSLHKLYFYTIPGIPDTGVYEARSILAFDENNIWITSGSQITKWDGVRQTFRHTTPVSINKLWGTDNSNIYAVGYNGQIAHYNGTNWQRIESGTALNINDIWGDYNDKTQEWEILAACGNILHGWEDERAIIRISTSNQSSLLNSTDAIWPISGVWFKANRRYYVIGSGIYNKYKLIDSSWNKDFANVTSYHTNKIKGSNINDIIIVGAYGETLHFNGYNWKSFINETFLPNGTYLSVNIKNNLVIAVGYQSAKAVITIGNR